MHTARRSELLCVAGILLLALALRAFVTVGDDEGAWVVGTCDESFLQQVELILQTGNPLSFEVFFYPPAPAIIVTAFAGLWRMVGGGGTAAVQCRLVTLMVSLATVGVVYALGRLWGRRHALIAMTLYAVAMIAVVVQSNVQVYSTFFVSLALYAVLRAAPEGRLMRLAFAGIWLGLAVASKYTPIFFAGLLFASYVLDRWRARSAIKGGTAGVAQAESGALPARVWTGGVSVLIGLAVVILWVGVMEREWTYSLLRALYQQRAHENPFEHHLAWIDRLYRAGLAGVGLAGAVGTLALLVPWCRQVSAWQWARAFCVRNRLWIVPNAALILTMGVVIGLPAVLNLGEFAGQMVGMAKMQSTGDNGMFPTSRPAVSYIGGYIPESMGLALFIAGLVGLLYALARRDTRAVIAIGSAIPAYFLLEMSRVKVNRYALELAPLWCLLAAIWLGDLCARKSRAWRFVGAATVGGIVAYSLVYTLGWAEFSSPRGDVRKQTAEWLNTTIPHGASLGVRSTLLVTGSPELLPDATSLAGYRLVGYTDDPEYVLVPNGVHAIVAQYLEAARAGYVYTASDWYVSAPSAEDLDVLSRIVRGNGYLLVKEFRKRPAVLGFEVRSDSLTGRTWHVEHSAAAGIRVYRRLT